VGTNEAARSGNPHARHDQHYVFDAIFLDKYGALASATIYTALLFVILAFNAEQVTTSFQALILPAQSNQKTTKDRAKLIFVALTLMGILFAFDQMLVNYFGHGIG